MEDFSLILYLFLAGSLILCCVSWKKYNYELGNYITQRNRIIGINNVRTNEFINAVNAANTVNAANSANAANAANAVNESAAKPPLYEDINV
jgi:hypothetical protein